MPGTRRLANPLEIFIAEQGVVILDGGLATELENRGCDLTGDLWSARLLMDSPDLIRRVHLDYLAAGADCIISASYQASIEGFGRHGVSEPAAVELIERSVELAREARDSFWSENANRPGRIRPIVAASVGPYGAYLADGSEFTGDYDLNHQELVEFHRRRWQILAGSGADLLACETVPSWVEARALVDLARTTPEMPIWLSFSCGSGSRLNDGSPIAEVISDLEQAAQIVAFGVNCTAPHWIAPLIRKMRSATSRTLLLYPNSGEDWDSQAHRWLRGHRHQSSLAENSEKWRRLGAGGIGGCCRTTPADIGAVRRCLLWGETRLRPASLDS